MKKDPSPNWANRIRECCLPVQNPSEMADNLKRNWYFPISAGAFFCISARMELGYYLAMVIALVGAVIVASQISSVWQMTWKKSSGIRLVSLLSACGTCWAGFNGFMRAWQASPQTKALDALLPIPMQIICIFGAAAALFFVYFYTVLFWSKMKEMIPIQDLLWDATKIEWVVYGILLAGTLIYSGLVFSATDAFYGTAFEYDVIYTSDSPAIVAGNAYLVLTHLQNDIRQPLFAVFGAPFLGIPYLLGRLAGGSAVVSAVLMNSVQVGMLFAANFILTKVLELDARKRICWMVLSCCTYTHLLFCLMMEQYIIAYFWLVLCIYVICKFRQPDRFSLWGAGGTLLTSMVLLPLMSGKHPIREFKAWFLDMVRIGMEFVAVMLIFCRFDVIFGLVKTLSELNTFTGHSLTWQDKLYQYTAFVSGIFMAPEAGEGIAFTDAHISWQMEPICAVSTVGIAIVLLALLSAVLNWKKKSTRIAIGWIGFSMVMLVGLGWGTAENGLILYALYFGWAYFVLLFQLAEWIEEMTRVKWLIPAVSAVTGVCLLCVNIPAIAETISFAITNFPL